MRRERRSIERHRHDLLLRTELDELLAKEIERTAIAGSNT